MTDLLRHVSGVSVFADNVSRTDISDTFKEALASIRESYDLKDPDLLSKFDGLRVSNESLERPFTIYIDLSGKDTCTIRFATARFGITLNSIPMTILHEVDRYLDQFLNKDRIDKYFRDVDQALAEREPQYNYYVSNGGVTRRHAIRRIANTISLIYVDVSMSYNKDSDSVSVEDYDFSYKTYTIQGDSVVLEEADKKELSSKYREYIKGVW